MGRIVHFLHNYFLQQPFWLQTWDNLLGHYRPEEPTLRLPSPGLEPPTLTLPERYQLSQRVNSLASVVITPVRHTHTRLHSYEQSLAEEYSVKNGQINKTIILAAIFFRWSVIVHRMPTELRWLDTDCQHLYCITYIKIYQWRQSIVRTVDSDLRIYCFYTGQLGHNIQVLPSHCMTNV